MGQKTKTRKIKNWKQNKTLKNKTRKNPKHQKTPTQKTNQTTSKQTNLNKQKNPQPANQKKGLGNIFLKLEFGSLTQCVTLWKTWHVLWVVISSTHTSFHEDLEHNGKLVFFFGIPDVYSSSPCFPPLLWLYHLLCLPVHNLLQGNHFCFIKDRDFSSFFLPSPLCFSQWMGKHLALLSWSGVREVLRKW